MRFRWQQFGFALILTWTTQAVTPLPSFAQTSAPAATAPTATATAPRSFEEILALENPTERITALQQFLKTNPNGENANSAREALVASHAQLGEVQLGDNNIEKAFESFQRAIRALPKQISDRFFEETVSKIPMIVATRGYRAEAVLLGKTIEMRFASEAERLAAIGEFYLTIEASGEAIHALENAAQLAPEDGRLQRALGAAYRMGLRIDDAVAAYQLAVRFDPKDRRAYYDLANLYRSQGAYEDALKLYRKQLEIDPKHSASYKGLALAYTALGKDDQAAAALNQVRDLRGSSDEITQDILLQTQLAFYLLAQGKVKAARQAAEAALLIEPRFSWARIAAAEVEMADRKFFEAERHLLAAQQFANFPTLSFTLGKLYLIVEDFDGATEHLAKAFSYSPTDKFTTRLGGIRDMQSDELRDLLAPEHQAAIFLAEPPTSDELFKIAESLTRTDARLLNAKPRPTPNGEKGAGKAREKSKEEPENNDARNEAKLEQSVKGFVEAEASRRPFRALYMARRLAQAGRALPLAIELAGQALEVAETATEAEGSLPDLPNYDREGRLRTFRGRAYDARGWAEFKAGHNAAAVTALSEAVAAYGALPEHKEALRHLATAKETAGEFAVALEMYLAAYEPADKNRADLNRTAIEVLYRKVNGSLNGLPERLGQPLSAKTAELIASTAQRASKPKAEAAKTTVAANNEAEKANAGGASSEFNPNQLLAQRTGEGNKTNPRPLTPNAATGSSVSAANKTGQPNGEAGSQESLRVGLLGIPVKAGTLRNPPPQFSKPAPREGTTPNAAPSTATSAPREPVADIAKALPPAPATEKNAATEPPPNLTEPPKVATKELPAEQPKTTEPEKPATELAEAAPTKEINTKEINKEAGKESAKETAQPEAPPTSSTTSEKAAANVTAEPATPALKTEPEKAAEKAVEKAAEKAETATATEAPSLSKEKPVELPAAQPEIRLASAAVTPPLDLPAPPVADEAAPEKPAEAKVSALVTAPAEKPASGEPTDAGKAVTEKPEAEKPKVENSEAQKVEAEKPEVEKTEIEKAGAEKVEAEKAEPPALPVLDEGKLAAVPLAPVLPLESTLWQVTLPPTLTFKPLRQPPAPGFTTDSGVTVQYELLPNAPAAAAPPAAAPPVSTRPRRVHELVPVTPEPAPSSTRKRRTNPPPSRPERD